MGTAWDLSRLRFTVRKLCGKFDENQLPSVGPGPGNYTPNSPPGVDDYINDFYLYDMPEHMRTLKLRQFFTFTTKPNVGTYNVPQYVIQIYDPIYVDNYQFSFYQDPGTFYRIWPELNFIDQNLFFPDGTTTVFNFFLTQTPVQQGTVVIGLTPNLDGTPSPVLETFTDVDSPIPLDIPTSQFFVNPGVLTGNQGSSGTIDYLTGEVNISYLNPPPNGVTSSCHYHPYVASRPRDIMFWQQQLFLRPIPNDTYAVKLMSYVLPTAAISAATNTATQGTFSGNNVTGTLLGFDGSNPANLTNVPNFNEWWQMIAYGAAIKILVEEGDYEEANNLKGVFEEQKLLAQRKTLKELAGSRIPSRYAEGQSGSASWPVFPIF